MSDIVDEKTSLLGGNYKGVEDIASSLSGKLGINILVIQLVAAVLLYTLFSYDAVSAYDSDKYMIFRDIMVMLLLGFGYCKFSYIDYCLLCH